MGDYNARIIEEFRANGGTVGGSFAGRPLLLLHHEGARSGIERISPLAYQEIEGGYAVFASKGGSPNNPAWFHNLRANPDTKVEVGTEMIAVHARVTDGEERERIWTKQKQLWPGFAEYELRTDRSIPVIALERI